MSLVELDFSRAKLLADNKPLALIVCSAPRELVFDGRPSCASWPTHCTRKEPCPLHRLEWWQLLFDELRALFLTTKKPQQMRELASELPRIEKMLVLAATGWRDGRGVVHRFAVDNPALKDDDALEGCAHGRSWDEACERCAAEQAECDAL